MISGIKKIASKLTANLLEINNVKRLVESAGYKIANKNSDILFLKNDDFLKLEKRTTELLFPGYLQTFLKKYQINCVFDVGANEGQYALLLRKIGYQGHIFSFEPIKKSFDNLVQLSKNDSLWKVFNIALGSEKSTGVLNITNKSDFSSFLTPNSYSVKNFGSATVVEETAKVTIERLEDLYDELTSEINKPIVFLKVDTQGFDLEVLKGAEKCLHNFVGIQSEISAVSIYENMPNYLMSFSTFSSFGFELAGLFTIVRDSNTLKVVEYDCFMVRKSDFQE